MQLNCFIKGFTRQLCKLLQNVPGSVFALALAPHAECFNFKTSIDLLNVHTVYFCYCPKCIGTFLMPENLSLENQEKTLLATIIFLVSVPHLNINVVMACLRPIKKSTH